MVQCLQTVASSGICLFILQHLKYRIVHNAPPECLKQEIFLLCMALYRWLNASLIPAREEPPVSFLAYIVVFLVSIWVHACHSHMFLTYTDESETVIWSWFCSSPDMDVWLMDELFVHSAARYIYWLPHQRHLSGSILICKVTINAYSSDIIYHAILAADAYSLFSKWRDHPRPMSLTWGQCSQKEGAWGRHLTQAWNSCFYLFIYTGCLKASSCQSLLWGRLVMHERMCRVPKVEVYFAVWSLIALISSGVEISVVCETQVGQVHLIKVRIILLWLF